MADVFVTSAAERDFTEALCWYAQRSRDAAEGFDAEFEVALRSIGADPIRYPSCDQRHRYYLMRRYPYQVIDRAERDEVAVVAVAHAKREPGYWSGR